MDKELQQLFDSKHTLSYQSIARLTEEQRHALAEMVRGGQPTRDVTVAMQAITKAVPETARSAIRYLLERKNLPGYLRGVGVIQMARLGGPEAEEVIIKSLELDETSLVAVKVGAALARIGTKRSIPTLKRLVKLEGAVGRQASLAIMLVGARMKDYEFMPQAPEGDRLFQPEGDARRFRMKPSAKAESERAIKDVEGDTFGVDPSSQAITIACGHDLSVLILDRELLESDTLSAFVESPRIVGLIAHRAPEDGSYSTRYVLASWPFRKGKSVHLTGYRTDGVHYLYGTLAALAGTEGRFFVSGVREGTSLALHVDGHVKKNGIFFDELECAEQVTGKKRLKRVDVASLSP